MKKIYLILATIAGVVLTSCSSEEVFDTSPIDNVENDIPIVFGSLSKGFTRTEFTGRDAATKLGNKFVVSGYKGSKAAWDASTSKIVFDNYVVKYSENSAHTTESNVANWEYVGQSRIKPAIDNGITSQTVKYWDLTKNQYNFIAWSTGNKTAIFSGAPGDGEVLVSPITPAKATGTGASAIAYSFTGKAADLNQCYIADLVTVKKPYNSDPVVMKFRQLGTKVRIGIYETIPGYSVKNVKFYKKAGLLTTPETEITETPVLFTTVDNDIHTYGTYTVTFPTVDTPGSEDNNQAHVSFSSTQPQTTVLEWGALHYTAKEEGEKNGTSFLGRTSNAATYAYYGSDYSQYKFFMPNEIGTNLNLRVNYTLEATDGSGEEIEVKNAKAQIPSIYTKWLPGYAYTYLFKISDKTNGRTGVYDPTQSDDATVNSDPAGLYPITFDAVVVNAEDDNKKQETITTVAVPSITTYQQYSTVVNSNEYAASGKDIFVTVNEGDDLVTLTDKATIYKVIGDGKETEADVTDALQIRDDYPDAGITILGRNGVELIEATPVETVADINAADKYTLTNSVQFGADGNAISVGANQALRFKPAAHTTYAFVYTKTAPTAEGNTDRFEYVTVAANGDVTHLYRDFNFTAITGDAQFGKAYVSYGEDGSLDYQPMFVGQGVANLYKRTGGSGTGEDPYTYESATGYAVTGSTYYYTTDGGATYKEAATIAYADFGEATDLYTFDGENYTAKTDAAPVDGTAYYKKTMNGEEAVYTYCVILPQQVNGLYLYEFSTTEKFACLDGEKKFESHLYYDKYTQNDGEYYTKVIKVK